MIATILRIAFLNLRRDRVAQALTFLLPIIFFSIFASVFGNQSEATSRVRVAVADEDQSEYSKALVKALMAEGGLRVQTVANPESGGPQLDRTAAEALVREGTVPVAVVLPKGFSSGSRFWERDESAPRIQLLADVSDPVAPQVVRGLLQKVSFTADPGALASEGMTMLEKHAGALTPQQREAAEVWQRQLANRSSSTSGTSGRDGGADIGVPIDLVNVLRPGEGSTATISFFAAGIGVMFLLFSAAGAGGTLLEEEEAGTLGRLVSARGGMRGVLIGKWIFIALIGVLQLTVMFSWGALVFGLPLLAHLPGFLVMTVATSAAAAAFGLLLATACRSRAQLSGISTILILSMSAVGGSMFPRFLMSDTMQTLGLVTFNAWALDGYIKVFWREAPVMDLWPQVAVLLTLCGVFLALSRLAARRWETL